jgi:hypothetical protein
VPFAPVLLLDPMVGPRTAKPSASTADVANTTIPPRNKRRLAIIAAPRRIVGPVHFSSAIRRGDEVRFGDRGKNLSFIEEFSSAADPITGLQTNSSRRCSEAGPRRRAGFLPEGGGSCHVPSEAVLDREGGEA